MLVMIKGKVLFRGYLLFLPPLSVCWSPFSRSLFVFLPLSLLFPPPQGVYKVGIQVTGSLSYHIIPEASTTVCDTSPKGDANACFEVYSQTNGRISIYAFWRKRQARCSWSWRGPRCSVRKLMLKFTYIVTNALSCILKIIIVVSIELISMNTIIV